MKKLIVLAIVAVVAVVSGLRVSRIFEKYAARAETAAVAASAPVKQTTAPAPPSPASISTSLPRAAAKPPPPTDWKAAEDFTHLGLSDVLDADNHYHDDQFGVTATLPEGWRARDAALRWGKNNGENTLWMTPDPPTSVSPSMYYQKYPAENRPDLTLPEAYFRGLAEYKENSRITGGLADYKNVPDSFEFTQINGNPAMTYFATFTRGDQVMTEHFIRVLGPNGYVMFFTMGKLEDVKTILPQLKQMAASVHAP